MDTQVALKQIDRALQELNKVGDLKNAPTRKTAELITLLTATIDRLAPAGSIYI